jgi:hypothetical protein
MTKIDVLNTFDTIAAATITATADRNTGRCLLI